MMRSGIIPRLGIEFGDAKQSSFFSALKGYLGIQSRESHCEIRNNRTDTGIAGEEAVILVFAMARVACITTFLKAEDVSMTIVPAAGVLCEIAADRGHVANLLRTYFGSGLLKPWESPAECFMILQFGNRHIRTDDPGLFA